MLNFLTRYMRVGGFVASARLLESIMQSLRSERVYGENDYVEAFSDGRQLPDSIIGEWCDCVQRAAGSLGLVRPILADLGCGDGRFTVPLARRFRLRGRIFAIDKSRPMLERLRGNVSKSNLENITVVLDDICSLALSEFCVGFNQVLQRGRFVEL